VDGLEYAENRGLFSAYYAYYKGILS